VNRILTDDIWPEAKRRAPTASGRKLAIAYVTADHIGMRAGDVLVVDASVRSISSGQTDAKLLADLHEKGVAIHSHEGLHSKVMLLGKYAIVGSANMSGADLTEAAVLTDEPAIRSGVASFIAQLSTKRSHLKEEDIAALCEIEVIRTGWPKGKRKRPKRLQRMGSATWIVGTSDLVRDPTAGEQKQIDRATSQLNDSFGTMDEEYDWIRRGKKAKFAKECRVGDTLINIHNPRGNRARVVTRRLPILLRRTERNWVRVYTGEAASRADEISWSRFQRILREAGHPRKVRPFSVQRLEPEMAATIDRK
jgi:hypothetical protein